MTIDERLDRLTGVVESLAASVVESKRRVDDLLKVEMNHDEEVSG